MNEIEPISYIYDLLSKKEVLDWTDIDESISILEWISDHQTYIEIKVLFEKYDGKTLACFKKHSQSKCIIPTFVDAVNIILKNYEQVNKLTPKYRYLLQYFLALEHVGYIVPQN